MIRVLGLSLYGPLAASHRVRLLQYQSGLQDFGIDLSIHSLLDDIYLTRTFSRKPPSLAPLIHSYLSRIATLLDSRSYDISIVHCELLPFVPGFIEQFLLGRIPYIYDCDDAFFLKYKTSKYRHLSPFLGNKIDNTIMKASAVTAGNDWLASYSSSLNTSVHILPSVVDTTRFRPSLIPVQNDHFTIGWIGSPSTQHHLELLVTPLRELSTFIPIRLIVIGGCPPNIDNVEIIQHDWDFEKEVSLIQQFDVGIMPLFDNPWTRGKCSYKLIQYMACGVPVVASRVGSNIDVVTPDCGFLAESSSDWANALKTLALNSALRRTMGQACLNRVDTHFSLHSTLPSLSGVIHSVTLRHNL